MGLHHRSLDLADELDRATGEPIAQVVIEVIDRESLLEHHVVDPARIHRRDMRVVVDHVVATQQSRGISQPFRVLVIGTGEQQRGGVCRTGSKDERRSVNYEGFAIESPVEPCNMTSSVELHLGDARTGQEPHATACQCRA